MGNVLCGCLNRKKVRILKIEMAISNSLIIQSLLIAKRNRSSMPREQRKRKLSWKAAEAAEAAESKVSFAWTCFV